MNDNPHSSFEELFDGIDTITENGKTWYVLRDVLDKFGFTEYDLYDLDEEDLCIIKCSYYKANPHVQCVTEAGVYQILLYANSQKAQQFQRWVYDEGLPNAFWDRVGFYDGKFDL